MDGFLITLFILCISGFALTTANAQDATVTDVKITINFSPYEEKFPNGVKGKEYRVFDATAVDNLGNELTDAQSEYFKDSKVRDSNGNLMALYHGKCKHRI